MYIADPRFTETYERVQPGLAAYVHDAIVTAAAGATCGQMRVLAPLACALALGGCAAAAAAPDGHPRLRERRILEIALAAARGGGDAHPTLIQHSAGTREAANRVDSGDIVPGRRWSYLIAERGRFVLGDAPVPMGAPAPDGTVLTLVVDAASGQVTDEGVSDRYPRLARLGPVTTDLRRRTE